MPRPPQLSIAPCISCTSCGAEVPIYRFGEHSCGPQSDPRNRDSVSRPQWTPSPGTAADDYPRHSAVPPLEQGFEEVQRSLHSSEHQPQRNASASRSSSSRASSATFASSIGRSASNASSALSSVSAESHWEDPRSKSIDLVPQHARTHTRQFSASSTYAPSGPPHSRNSSVSSGVVSREDAMYRAHPSCMEDRVKAPKTEPRMQHHRTVSSQDGHIDLNAADPARRAPPRTCRGCTHSIVGKAIRDGSGRLTGHWHKSCFACTRCLAPFTTAEFFVIDDKPYCEHDYHELNGSLCSMCHGGIEGPCLETPQRQRFHPQCLRCTTCQVSLDAGYLDLNGRVFCEQHGLATMQRNRQGPPTNMQRRTTRLLVV